MNNKIDQTMIDEMLLQVLNGKSYTFQHNDIKLVITKSSNDYKIMVYKNNEYLTQIYVRTILLLTQTMEILTK